MELFLYFMPLAVVISLVCSGTRREEFDQILTGAARFFAYLSAGTVVFSGLLQFTVNIPMLFYSALTCLVALLSYYVVKEITGLSKKKKEQEDGKDGEPIAHGPKSKV